MTTPKIITVAELRRELADLLQMPDETRVYFGGGDLSFYRVKNRGPMTGPQLMQIAFNQVYTVTADPEDPEDSAAGG